MVQDRSERVEVIDALRGFALLGVCWANLLVFSGIAFWSDEQRLESFGGIADQAAYLFERFFIENKFMGLFSLLFGVSFWLFLRRVEERGVSPRALYYRRIAWLFVIGAVHGWLFWCFDILRFYALWALLLPLFIGMSPRILLALALSMALLVPAGIAAFAAALPVSQESPIDYDAAAFLAFREGSWSEAWRANWEYDWNLTLHVSQLAYQTAILGRLLLGLYAARTLDLQQLGRKRPLLWRLALCGAVIGVVGSSVFTFELFTSVYGFEVAAKRVLIEAGQLGWTLAYASAFVLLSFGDLGRALSSALAPIGRMALTWYLFQTAFALGLFYAWTGGPALMGRVGPAMLALLALASFILQALAARWWLQRFRQGPAEWCWRSLTWWQLQPMRR